MRAFMLLCLVAVTSAGKLGYDYGPGGRTDSLFGGNDGNDGISRLGRIGGNDGIGRLGRIGGNDGIGRLGRIGGNDGIGRLGRIGGDDSGLGLGGLGNGLGGSRGNLGGISDGSDLGYDSPNYAPSVEYEKEFYTFTAPENEFDDPLASQKVAGSLRKGLRVVFIKGPENRGLENAALSLAKQAAEQRTAIYVLNKQTDIGDLANKLNAIRSDKNNKPEVHFVKYRTPEDAANAQRAIQSQYDNELGGNSRSLDGGVAPVINFASRGPVRQAISRQPDNSYLPASIFRRLRRFRY